MSTSSDSHDYGRFDELAEEFAERYRRGERPTLQEYIDRLPGMADEIREIFPALVEVEQAEADARGDPSPPSLAVPRLRQVGDYRILRELGRGGMGVVYEAEQVSLGRRVALKVLTSHVAGDSKALERFRREAKAAARLHHTNIVPVFEVGREGDLAFYAMQLIQGQGLDLVIDELRRLRAPDREPGYAGPAWPKGAKDLATVTRDTAAASDVRRQRALGQMAELLLSGRFVTEGLEPRQNVADDATIPAQTEPFDPDATSGVTPRGTGRDHARARPELDVSNLAVFPGGTHVSEVDTSGRRQPFFRSVALIGRQAAQGLAYAHARGIVHRDVKPSNLLLDSAGVVWITDFGLAKGEDDGLTATGDILGTLRYMAPERYRGEGDSRADVYALGITLYELLTLRPAYVSSDRLELVEQIKNDDPARPRSIDSRIPRDLETIVLKAMDKDPKERYPSADAMAEDLRRFLADEPIKARQVSTTERYWRWARRNPVIAILGGVLTAVLIAVTIGSMVAASRYGMIARSEKLANDRSQLDRKDAIEARRQAITERDHSRRLSAGLALDKGFALAQEGHADWGLLWMLEALKTAPDDAEEFRRTVRWNLGAWLGQIHKVLRIIDTGGPCSHVAFSPDGRSFVTGFIPSADAIARPIDLWETVSGRKLYSLPGTRPPFAFRPDGKVLVAYSNSRCMVAIELVTRQVLWTTPPLPEVHGRHIAYSPDGSTLLATRSDQLGHKTCLSRLDVVTGQERGEPLRGRGHWGAMTLAPDGRTIALERIENGEAYVDVLDVPSVERTASWQAGGQELFGLLFSPDGRSLFTSVLKGDFFSQDSYFGQIWDLGMRRPISPSMARTSTASYTPAGDRLVTLTGNVLVARDAADRRVRGSGFPADVIGPWASSFSSASHLDGRIMLAAARDNTARLWQVSADAEPVSNGGIDNRASVTGSLSNRQTRGFHAFGASLRTDGQIAISLAKDAGGRELIQLSNPTTGRHSGRPAPHYPGWVIGAVTFSPDGRYVATGSNPDGRTAGEVRLWDASTGRLLLPPMLHTNYPAALAFHPEGKVLAAGDYNGLVRFWDTSTGREIGRPIPQGEIVLSLAYSPDGKMLAVGLAMDKGKPGTRLWDTTTQQPLSDLLPGPDAIRRLEFRPDGRALLAGNGRSTTQLWDTTRGQALGKPMVDEAAGGFRPDGLAFLTAGRDGTVKLHDATTGAVLARLLTCSSPTTCAAFRGDGGLIAAGFEDGAVRLCDPATSQPVGPPRSMRHAVHQVAFTSDGRSVAAIDEFGESRSWPVPGPIQDESLDDSTLRIEGRTGLRMETSLAISRLDIAAWRERLEQLGRLDPAAVQPDDDPAWHEPMIREAEQNGNAFAARWHLDRLIAARPDDWFLYARRARTWSRSDQFAKAAADYEQAERLGKRDDVLDFHTHCVIDCTKAERWTEALWYLDRLIAARPDDRSLLEDRAAVYGKLGREADRQAELARVFELGADEGLVVPRAEVLGRAGRWAEALGLLARCGRRGPLSRELAQAWGIACLKARDRAGYREACAAFMAREGPDPTVVWNALAAASLLALAPGAIEDDRVPIAWFEKRLFATPAPRPLYRHVFSNALGGLLLRAGRLDEAIARLNEGIAAKEVELPTDWTYLALAHARSMRFDDARRWLERLRTWQANASDSFWDLQELDLHRSEAESLLFDAEFPSDPFQSRGPR